MSKSLQDIMIPGDGPPPSSPRSRPRQASGLLMLEDIAVPAAEAPSPPSTPTRMMRHGPGPSEVLAQTRLRQEQTPQATGYREGTPPPSLQSLLGDEYGVGKVLGVAGDILQQPVSKTLGGYAPSEAAEKLTIDDPGASWWKNAYNSFLRVGGGFADFMTTPEGLALAAVTSASGGMATPVTGPLAVSRAAKLKPAMNTLMAAQFVESGGQEIKHAVEDIQRTGLRPGNLEQLLMGMVVATGGATAGAHGRAAPAAPRVATPKLTGRNIRSIERARPIWRREEGARQRAERGYVDPKIRQLREVAEAEQAIRRQPVPEPAPTPEGGLQFGKGAAAVEAPPPSRTAMGTGQLIIGGGRKEVLAPRGPLFTPESYGQSRLGAQPKRVIPEALRGAYVRYSPNFGQVVKL